MRVLVTGGAGSIGSELVRQLVKENEVFILDIDETRTFDLMEELGILGRVCDVTDFNSLAEVFQDFLPDIVIHAAAFKHVSLNELNSELCIKVNVFGTINIIRLCRKHGARLVNISTDKVVKGVCIMGITKKLSERLIKNAGFISVRFGNVMASRGSVISIWERQLLQGKPLTITDPNCERYKMSIPQAVSLILEAAEVGRPGELRILDMGDRVKISDLLRQFLDAHKIIDYPVQIIGLRPGETLVEKLWSDDENPRKEGKFYVI